MLNTPAPAFSDPVWAGHTDGTVVTVVCHLDGANGGAVPFTYWVAPGSPANANPLVLAQQVIASFGLRPITIGLVPEAGPGKLGAVGMPVWMWVDAPTPSSFGPISDSAAAGPVRVSVSAHVVSIDWDMGDGTIVHCAGTAAQGTIYQDVFDTQSSPTCGHRYTRQGDYTITATAHWIATWSDTTTSGTVPVNLVATTTRRIGELQAITIK